MPKQIWKFKIPIDGIIEMPACAEVLTIETQMTDKGEEPFVWAVCDTNPNIAKVKRQFFIWPTGKDLPKEYESTNGFHTDGWKYHGTFHMVTAALVFHVFEART